MLKVVLMTSYYFMTSSNQLFLNVIFAKMTTFEAQFEYTESSEALNFRMHMFRKLFENFNHVSKTV